ncbi:cytochrome P450 [Sphingobium sp.]|uniref:cytochrome P450 n=1 Tax=Sphingobium sp. TaxID=1912891 RepID=UPI0028BEE13F|nr:cytochrome P450 [Sphingobium sp.]
MSRDQPVAQAFHSFSTRRCTPAEAIQLMDLGRGECPVPYSHELGGFHIFRNYADVAAGMTDWRTYGSAPSVARPLPAVAPESHPRTIAIHYDPPEHGKWRALLVEGINPGVPDRIRSRVEANVRARMEGIADRGGGDLMHELAVPVALDSICEVIGFSAADEEKARIVELSQIFISRMRDSEDYVRKFTELGDIGLAEIDRRNGAVRDDFISFIAGYTFDGCPLSRKQLNDTMATLFAAGHGTTANAIGGMLWDVLTRPHILAALRADAGLIPNAIEESLRLHAPFFGLFRTARHDHEVHGVAIRNGESVMMAWQAANLDPARFDEPHEYRLDRPDYRHMTFGRGRHACVGAPTARMEMEVVLRELLRRSETFLLVEPHGDPFEFEGSESAGPRSLRVTIP